MVTYKKISEPGSREINEDYAGVAEKDGQLVCVLCDGLGGHGRGEDASKLVADEIINFFLSNDNFIDRMDEAFECAQKKLLEEQKIRSANHEMRTTAVVLAVTDKEVRWGHIGDSRAYMFKRYRYKKRTVDHSVPQMLVLAKEIKEKEIRNHPDRNKLLRVMGIEWGTNSYVISKKIRRKRSLSFLLCSDGFWELIDEKNMSSLLKGSAGDVGRWVDSMCEVVEKNGRGKNTDNFSAIAVML